MIVKITRPITCTDSTDCHEVIQNKLEGPLGIKLHTIAGGDSEGYLHVIHKAGNHLIIVCIYDSPDHEFVQGLDLADFQKTGNVGNRAIVKRPPDAGSRFKQFTGTVPNRGQLEAALND